MTTGRPGRYALTASVLLFACAATARAHDFWIEPGSFTPSPGTTLPVRLRVGMHFSGEAVPRRPDRIEWFAVVGPGGERPVEGEAGADPAGSVRLESPGLHILVYRSRKAFIELDGKGFEEYLAEEGLREISALRAKRGQSAASARELYSRCCKSLVQVGSGATGGHDRVVGFPLELIPEANPFRLAGGGSLPVRLVFDGKPLPAANVEAMSRNDPRFRVTGRTDGDGRVILELKGSGVWLVKSVHMIESELKARADWESFWATLTFEIPASPTR